MRLNVSAVYCLIRPCLAGLFLASLTSFTLADAATDGSSLGIVKEKPSDGIFVEVDGKFMVPYTAPIPGTDLMFTMVPVPGGTFTMGSPEGEKGRQADEGPQREIKIDPFWIGESEVSWAEYKSFMGMYNVFKDLSRRKVRSITADNRVDAITAPTPLYEPSHTYELGDDPQQPAVTMTQYAAKQYTKWLSGLTGCQYRLPTEAEWEYAARAGSQSAYSFGDDASKLAEYAAFEGNSDGGPAKIKSFAPNAFGLFDMHGNAWEWVIDGYDPSGYPSSDADTLGTVEAISWAKEASSRTVRGGGFQDTADRLRSAARMGSEDEEWKDSDPNIPKSPWWFTDDPARSVGMRLTRSYTPLDKELLTKFWEIDNEDIEIDVDVRLEEGRGVLGIPVPELAEDIKAAGQ